jgi:hypothetical protein
LGNNTTDFVLTIRGTPGSEGDMSTFDANVDAGVGIELTQFATATATVKNAAFDGNTNGANARFFGDGFGVSAINNAAFTNSLFGDAILSNTRFNGNQGSGFQLSAGNNFALANNILLRNSDFSGNTTDGLNIHRNSAGQITNVVINASTINNNTGDGIDIEARSQDSTDTYTITNNIIDGNNQNGVRGFVEFDADIDVLLMDGNQITNNGQDGVHVTENAAATDNRSFTALVTDNIVDDNGDDGIEVSTVYDVTVDTNQITGNGQNGINFNGAGNSLIQNTFIDSNGRSGIQMSGQMFTTIQDNDFPNGGTISNNALNGVEIHASAFSSVDVLDNLIEFNGNDGVQLETSSGGLFADVSTNTIFTSGGDAVQLFAHGGGSGSSTVTVELNDIMDSGRRGINVVNAGISAVVPVRTQLNIDQNNIEFSQFEAIYVVNTTVEAQGQGANIDANANVAMLTSDSLTVDVRLALNVTDNFVRANGQNGVAANFIGGGTQNATGLVLRVSTSDANTQALDGNAGSFQNDGGFATNLTNATFTGNVTNANVVRGGVGANVDSNQFVGQFGADVTFEGFVSTNAPPTTVGTWTDQNDSPRLPGTADVFTITSYTQDPLARLDLRFVGNTGDGAIVTRSSESSAFFNNDEPVFKSRTVGQDGNDPPGNPSNTGTTGDDNGPFNSGTRRRNITRLADNTGAFDRPTLVGSVVDVSFNGFLYSGVGGSTFRRTSSSNIAGFTPNPQNTSFTTTVNQGGAVGETNFGWDIIP